MKRLRIAHHAPNESSRHIFQNFGEDLWRLTRDDRRWRVSLEEIDRADHSFDVVVRNSTLRRSVRFIEDLLARHFLADKVRIDVLDEG